MIRHLDNIEIIKTSHDVGMKKVLIAKDEVESNLTQIAVTELMEDEKVPRHVHIDMEEAFFVLEGDIEISLKDEFCKCKAKDFIFIPKGVEHEIKALTNVCLITIGCQCKKNN